MRSKPKQKSAELKKITLLSILALAAVLTVGVAVVPQANADEYDQQIQALRSENAQNKMAVSSLQAQATSYEDAIRLLQAQITSLQGQIEASQAEQARLQGQIVELQKQLDGQKSILAENIRVMYVEGRISTIEMLATSKNLSDFVDKEEYRTAIKNKIQSTLKQITRLQNELKEQKIKVDALIESQKRQQIQIVANRAEQSRLLALNTSEQRSYNDKIKANSDKIAKLQQAQVEANCRAFGGCDVRGIPGGGGYKYGNAVCTRPGYADPPCGRYDWGYPSASSPRDLYDEWGYGYRNCTSWVAFKLAQDGRTGFSGLGDATDWPNHVPSGWKSYGSGARVGDAAVRQSGEFGHVMYVESVNSDGTISVSDYNKKGDGYYRSAGMNPPISQSGLVFIHFP